MVKMFFSKGIFVFVICYLCRETKMEGLNLIRRLVKFHPEVITDQTHTVVVAVMNEVKNLRSSVSKLAIMCMAEMFQELKSAMDKVSSVVKSQDQLVTPSNLS